MKSNVVKVCLGILVLVVVFLVVKPLIINNNVKEADPVKLIKEFYSNDDLKVDYVSSVDNYSYYVVFGDIGDNKEYTVVSFEKLYSKVEELFDFTYLSYSTNGSDYTNDVYRIEDNKLYFIDNKCESLVDKGIGAEVFVNFSTNNYEFIRTGYVYAVYYEPDSYCYKKVYKA